MSLRTAAMTIAVGTLGVLVAGWSQRGDLAVPTMGVALSLGFAALVSAAIRAGLRDLRDPVAIARALARRRPSFDPVLHHELLGAVELERRLAAEASDGMSEQLARKYIDDINDRVREAAPDPEAACGPSGVPRTAAMLGVVAVLAAGLSFTETFARGLSLVLAAEDGRPQPPPEPLWSSLSITMRYPEHTGRTPRQLHNPSGAVRVPAGTELLVEMTPRASLEDPALIVTVDAGEETTAERYPLALTTVDPETRRASASFTVRSSGSWIVATGAGGRGEASLPFPIELEPDRPPEVELLPLPQSRRAPSELESVDLRFRARDDFGLATATLVFERPPASADGRDHEDMSSETPHEAGELVRLEIGAPPRGRRRTWNHRYTWDLSTIAIEERTELVYWIEVRDNDPGLGLTPLADPPGKVTRSARMRLSVRDEESEHARNVLALRDLRDAAVDLLAARMTTGAFEERPPEPEGDDAPGIPIPMRLRIARALTDATGELLGDIALLVDAISVDALTRSHDAETLAEIHGRLIELHRAEMKLHEAVPPDERFEDDDGAATVELLRQLGRHNTRQVSQLEDEIIRLDDLVDRQLIDRLERLVARLQASQQKLIELLEKLRAGDESVRGAIEQLQQRIADDLRRIAEARAELRKEVGEEFMNLDAFKAMEERLRDQDVMEQLRQGNVDRALESARESMDEIRSLRDAVHDRVENDERSSSISPEEKERIGLLRELSRLQDEERSIAD
ncbi:MAG: hypothetical protein R3A51_21075, partial [Nannocystaceae bacterium]